MFLPHVFSFEVFQSFVANMRLVEVLADYDGFEGHEVKSWTVEFVVKVVWAKLTSLIFACETYFLLVVYGKVMLLIKITFSDCINHF
jgi:hypothetical protein